MNNEVCHMHSGILSDIDNIKKSDSKQWEELAIMRGRIDNIMTRLNVILGGIVVAIVVLLLNIVIKIV